MRPDATQPADVPTLRLTPCAACGHDVSIAAASCPQCGHPRRATLEAGPVVTTQATGKDAKALGAIGGVLVLVGFMRPPGALTTAVITLGFVLLIVGWLTRWWRYE